MQEEISYEWSPELVRVGVRRFIFRYAGRWIIAVAIILVFTIAALAAGWIGNVWWLREIWLLLVILCLVYPAVWVIYYRRAMKICHKMPNRQITVRIEPESITLQTSEYTTTMKWPGIKQLWKFPEVWLLFTNSKQSYTILPIALLDEDLRQFIQEKVREHGGRVV